MGNKTPCCGPKNASLYESKISEQSSWKILIKHELKTSNVDPGLTWPQTILNALNQFRPIRPEMSFVSFTRWNDFLNLTVDDPALVFNPLIHEPEHNFYDYLTEDFQCPDNPVGLIIGAFSQGFIEDYHDSVQDLLDEPGEADNVYGKMLESILKFKSIAYKLICEFYKSVAEVVKSRAQDTEALLYTFVLQGEVYRLLYTAACISFASSAVVIKKAVDQHDCVDPTQLIGDNPISTATQSVLDECVKSIRLLGATESPYEKVAYQNAAVDKLNESTPDAKTRTRLLAFAVIKAKLTTVLAHVKLIEDFLGSKRGQGPAYKQAVELLERDNMAFELHKACIDTTFQGQVFDNLNV